jgi:hypothetical protein
VGAATVSSGVVDGVGEAEGLRGGRGYRSVEGKLIG